MADKKMVDRFLAWRLPETFAPDCGISFKRPNDPSFAWPVGTNLLTADEAKEMFEYVLRDRVTDNAEGQDQPEASGYGPKGNASNPAPAAPTQTPWTDAVRDKVAHVVDAEFARRLEALVHQQQEALAASRFTEYAWESGDMRDAALAAYAQLAKEMGDG